MFLKTLTLKGFKSFAESTALEMEPGVTVVVGPNGSGKSNVVDAIGWVLGAQAPSAVRSQKMDDVIFAGSAKRPALGRAEVALTIDNSSGILPIEFNEVTITPRREGTDELQVKFVVSTLCLPPDMAPSPMIATILLFFFSWSRAMAMPTAAEMDVEA